MKVIIKEPEEQYGRIEEIDGSLENLQSIVNGYIEMVTIGEDLVVLCNEDGRLLSLPVNVLINDVEFVGTIIACGSGEENFCDIPISFEDWMKIVNNGEA